MKRNWTLILLLTLIVIGFGGYCWGRILYVFDFGDPNGIGVTSIATVEVTSDTRLVHKGTTFTTTGDPNEFLIQVRLRWEDN